MHQYLQVAKKSTFILNEKVFSYLSPLSGIRLISDNACSLGPRLRQHHSHHQKPSVERHWASGQGRPNRETYQWLSAPVCQGRNVWNQTENTAHPDHELNPLLVKHGVHPLQSPPHIGFPPQPPCLSTETRHRTGWVCTVKSWGRSGIPGESKDTQEPLK